MGCRLIVFPMTDRFISKHRLGQNKRKQAQQENDEMRETKRDTEAIVEHIHALTMDAGLMPKGWRTQVDEGSPTYGNAWRIAAVCPKTGAHYRHPASASAGDYLGWSRGEANRTLRLMIQIVAAMGRTKKQNREKHGIIKGEKPKPAHFKVRTPL